MAHVPHPRTEGEPDQEARVAAAPIVVEIRRGRTYADEPLALHEGTMMPPDPWLLGIGGWAGAGFDGGGGGGGDGPVGG